MIEKIDASYVEIESVSHLGFKKYTTKRSLNNIEKDIVNKVNELVDKFNEVFPL